MLTPEVYEGHQPVSKQDMDAHGQYYLGLLGLELLLGRRPVEITCFKDLADKSEFFDNPRASFDVADDGTRRWTDECPALAFLLAKLLARRPGDRLGSADEAYRELRRVHEGRLPEVLRRCLEDDYADGAMGPEFAARFYDRLFAIRPSLRTKFSRPAGQAAHLAGAMRPPRGVRAEPSHRRISGSRGRPPANGGDSGRRRRLPVRLRRGSRCVGRPARQGIRHGRAEMPGTQS